jgi:hypothetical protein
MSTRATCSAVSFSLALGAAAALPAQDLRDGARDHLPDSLIGSSFATADLDGDGDLDLIAARGALRPVSVLRNSGHGVFSAWPAGGLGSQGLYSRTATPADVDRDGDVDIWFSGLGTAGPRLWLNQGGAVFVDAPARVPVGLVAVNQVALLDLEGDGDLDAWFAMGVTSPTAQRIARNDGSGTFSLLPTSTNQGFAQAGIQAVVADLDLDGDADVVARDEGGYAVARNNGLGAFTMDYFLNYPSPMLVGDVDGDRLPDLVLAEGSRVLRNIGNAAFVPGTMLPVPAMAGLLADLDGDGDHDLLATAQWLRNDGTGTFVAVAEPALRVHRTLAGHGPNAIAADFDGDGRLDVLRDEPTRRGLLFGDGRGGFTEASPALLQTPGTTLCVPVDAEGDGDHDLVTNLRGLTLLRNDSHGAFAAEPLTGVLPTYHRLVVGDLDGDLDQDLVAREAVSAGTNYVTSLVVFDNDGSGRFTASAARFSQVGSAQTGRLQLADLDLDGDLDLLDGMAGATPSLRLFRNDGHGALTDATAIALLGAPTGEAALAGDVDGDGDLDLVVGRSRATPTMPREVLRNTGWQFTPVPLALPATLGMEPLLLADLDADGDLDLVSRGPLGGAQTSATIEWNDGSGRFAASGIAFLPAPGGSMQCALATDLDDDGDQDLVFGAQVTASLTSATRAFRNDGAGAFTPIAIEAGETLDTVHALASADIDGDGDPDLIHGQLDFPVTLNQHLGLRLLERGRPGKPITIRLTHRPGHLPTPVVGLFLLAAGPAPSPVLIPGVGRTPLDPATAWVSPLLVLPAPQGHADHAAAVPPSAALVGATFWLHGAVIGTDGRIRLVNVVRETIGA